MRTRAHAHVCPDFNLQILYETFVYVACCKHDCGAKLHGSLGQM
jgi:hypothetical protein